MAGKAPAMLASAKAPREKARNLSCGEFLFIYHMGDQVFRIQGSEGNMP
jgi:hypothetical protein